MNEPPTLVAVYELVAEGFQRVAEFRLSPQDQVALTLTDSEGCPQAEQWYHEGVEMLDDGRLVMPDEGPTFMHALLQPFRMSYCRIVDESGRDTPTESTITPTHWSTYRDDQ
ncbi:hypothetical protein AB0C34_25395 [Nocardia sp. NPDC049220]|uniref:hypothetical protein n=1 Tax=Nocardia sp. NPDC049220 TaxID=3155273 RepID=UPI0033ED654A